MTPKITARLERITPLTAQLYLETMTTNRKPKAATIAMYANDMANDKWLLSPQGIAFDEEGALFDGQHRLKAVIRSGCNIDLLVIRGFPVKQGTMRTMDAIDCGAMRSLADRLALMGYVGNPNLSCAVARQIAAVVKGANSRCAAKLSLSAVIAIIGHYKREMGAVIKVADNPKYKPFRNAHTVAAFTIAAVADLKRIDLDMGRLFTGAGLDHGSPILELRNLLLMDGSIDRRQKTVICLSAIHAAWHGGSGTGFLKPAAREEAIRYFRSTQEPRFTAVENLFHQGEEPA